MEKVISVNWDLRLTQCQCWFWHYLSLKTHIFSSWVTLWPTFQCISDETPPPPTFSSADSAAPHPTYRCLWSSLQRGHMEVSLWWRPGPQAVGLITFWERQTDTGPPSGWTVWFHVSGSYKHGRDEYNHRFTEKFTDWWIYLMSYCGGLNWDRSGFWEWWDEGWKTSDVLDAFKEHEAACESVSAADNTKTELPTI